MFDGILAHVGSSARLYLFAPDATVDDPPIYFAAGHGVEPIAAKSQADLGSGLQRTFPLKFGDARWTLVVAPERAALGFAGHERSWIVLIFGLLLSGGMTMFIWAMRRQAASLETANRKFEVQNIRFDTALNNMVQGLLMFNAAGKLIIANRRFAKLFGVPWQQWINKALGMTVPETMRLVNDLSDVTETNQSQIMSEYRNIMEHREAGKIVFERTDGCTFVASISPMADSGLVVTFEDITERQLTEAKIFHMAHYDALTDLPNRNLFYERMEELLARVADGGSFAVLSLDLDRFKSVNDTLGHPIGDKLLQAVADRLRRCVRDGDTVARLGGDEFAILQTAFGQPTNVTGLAERLIATVGAPYTIDGHQVMVGTSVGIAIAPGDGAEPDQLMKNADLALYRAKTNGGGIVHFFEEEMDAHMQERHALELDLRKALVNDEFTINYQPIVNLKAGKIAGCEALIRWHRPGRGLVPPLDFIPLAEATGLIVPIGEWVLRRACADAADWPEELTVAVNVSPAQFASANFVGVVTDALAKSGLPASRLELEITELVLMQDKSSALTLFHQLKALGVSIAMDDFGTGYSSLGYLRSFPFDRIKIDQSFIKDLSKKKDSLAVLRAVVSLGHSLGILTTAEGIETSFQLETVRAEGCTEGQGYFSACRSARRKPGNFSCRTPVRPRRRPKRSRNEVGCNGGVKCRQNRPKNFR